MKWEFCPICSAAWDAWNENSDKCWNCGFVKEGEAIDAPQCQEHKKYEGKGAPLNDCLACWKMHKVYTDNKIKELSNASD